MTATLDQILAHGRVLAACGAINSVIESLAEVGDPLSQANILLEEIISSANTVN